MAARARPCTTRTRLFRLLNAQNRALCAPRPIPAHFSFPRDNSEFGKKIRENYTASVRVGYFNNATAVGTVHLHVSQVSLKQTMIPSHPPSPIRPSRLCISTLNSQSPNLGRQLDYYCQANKT
jgi:hypothetical protein